MSDPLLILNPGAGAIRNDPRLLTRLKAHGALQGVEVVIPAESGPEGMMERAREARDEGRSHLLAAGGDGTVHWVVNGLLDGLDPASLPDPGQLPTLGVLPLGTGNDLARSLGFEPDPWETLGVLDWERIRTMDVVRISGPRDGWCTNVITGGMAAREELAPGADVKADLGILSYVREGARILDGALPVYELELEVDDEPAVSLRGRIVAVANGRWAGAAMPVAPDALLDDGILEVLVVPELDLAEMGLLLPRLVLGSHHRQEAIRTYRGRRVSIRSQPELDVSLDGELVTAGEATFTAVGKALNVLIGPDEESSAFRS